MCDERPSDVRLSKHDMAKCLSAASNSFSVSCKVLIVNEHSQSVNPGYERVGGVDG